MTVVLSGRSLTLEELVLVARHQEHVELAPDVGVRMDEVRQLVDRAVERGDPIYGTTTGVGVRKRHPVEREELREFNRRLILDHRVAQGPTAGNEVVRATMLRLANGFASDNSGVRPELAGRVVHALNTGEQPPVRARGSTGVGDLGQLADLAWELFRGEPLEAREASALLNSSAFTTGAAALALVDALRLADSVDLAAALDFEAFAANVDALHPRVADVRPYPGLSRTLERFASILEGSWLWRAGAARNLQDPLVFRCLPQIHAALRDAFDFARATVETELNASQDNPLPLPAEDRFISVGNFDILPLAQALDLARIALAPALTSACERSLKLLQAPLTGLPEGLAARPGDSRSGLSEFAFPLQAMTAEARLLAQPVSFEVVSTTQAEGIEDRITMAPLGARRLAEMVALGERVVAIELVLACQAADLRGERPLGIATARAYELVRQLIPFTAADDTIPDDLEPVVGLVGSGAIA
jgi:histidine ammonia-lyase